MKRKVRALLALVLTLALVSTSFGDSCLYVSAENAAETEEQAGEPEAAVEEKTEAEPVSEETKPAQETETPAAEEQKEETPAPAEEPKQAEENTQPAEEIPAEQSTDQTPAEQPAETPAPADDQEQPADAAAPEETPAADATGETAEKAPEAETPGADEKATETANTEISLIEQTIEASVDTEEKDVVITLTGEMPEGAAVNACPVDISMDGINIITAYDITIYDAEGQEFQPSEEKPLQVKIEDDAVRKALEENAELEVYHLEDAEAEPEQVQKVHLDSVAVEFQAESFSIYVVGEHYTHTYQFLDEDGTKEINKQILSEGEVLNKPESPVKEHKKFMGWLDKNGDAFNEFEEEGSLSENITTVLKAKYESVYYVFYKADNHVGSEILYTQEYSGAEDKIMTDGVPFSVPAGMVLIGWSVDPDAETPDQELKLVGDDVTLYPIVSEAHWITYDTQGGTILDPTYVLANDVTEKPAANPDKVGYEFAGWFTDQECTKAYAFGNLLQEDINLYAKWTPGTATYTVIHWWENADDDKYSYHRSETKNGITGESTQATGTAAQDTQVTGKNLLGKTVTDTVFTAQNIVQQEIKGDGSTIVNVYYTRAKYALTFRKNSSTGTIETKIEKKYGESISREEWPSFTSNKRIYSAWKIVDGGRYKENRYLAYSSTMPLNGGNLWSYMPTGKGSATYYVEKLDGTGYEIHHEDSLAISDATIGLEDAYEINGFTFEKIGIQKRSNVGYQENYYEGDEIIGKYYDGAKFYYTRNKYNIIYHNGTEEHSNSYKFQESISNAGDYTPTTHPAGVDDDYEFAGWYQDPEGTMPYDFSGKTMPANNIIVYAKWVAPAYTVKFDLNGAVSGDAYPDQTVEKGKLAKRPEDPTREGYTFAGWTRDGSPFSFQTQITEDITLTAQWISNEKYPLTYKSNNGKSTTQADGESYAVGAEAKVIEVPKSDGWEAPDGMKEFLCWNTEADGSGTDYYPGNSFEMPENVTEEGAFLYAKWVPKRETVLKYDLNYENAGLYGSTVIAVPNEPYAIGNNGDDPAKENPTRDGYKFLGWSTNAGLFMPDTLLKKGDMIQVDTLREDDSNVLYAQWEELRKVTFKVKKQVEGNMGDYTKEFSFTYTIKKGEKIIREDSFKLRSGGLYTEIPEVSEGETIIIHETPETGYTTTIGAFEIINESSDEAGTFSYTVTKDTGKNITNVVVTYTNSKTMITPTGVASSRTPSLWMLLAGFGMAVVMLLTGKRRRV